jgi:benzoylformate decarboxylase
MTGHMFGSASLPILSRGDVNLVCGTYIVPEVFPELGSVFARGSKVVHIDLNAYEIGKNHPCDLAVVADPKLTLEKLAAALRQLQTPAQRSAAESRRRRLEDAARTKRQAAMDQDARTRDAVPMGMARFAEELAAQLPENAIVFDEALTCSPAIARYRPPQRTGDYFLTRGGSLGVGIPGAIGAKMANPHRPVVGFSGDGGAMYTIQALWTAARHKVDAKFVICNNGSYRLLQANIDQYWRERDITPHDYPLPFDLSHPPLGFVEMAKGMGVAGRRVERPSDVAPAIKQMLAHDGPFLVDLVVEGHTEPERIGRACGM